jgi:hypothetical protein
MLIDRNYRKQQVVVILSVGGMIKLLLLCFRLRCLDLLIVSDDSILSCSYWMSVMQRMT